MLRLFTATLLLQYLTNWTTSPGTAYCIASSKLNRSAVDLVAADDAQLHVNVSTQSVIHTDHLRQVISNPPEKRLSAMRSSWSRCMDPGWLDP